MHGDIARFVNGEGQVTKLPRKREMRQAVLLYLAQRFEPGRQYTEAEVNQIIDRWHTFSDYFLVRRDMIEFGVMRRTHDGRAYWRAEADPEAPHCP